MQTFVNRTEEATRESGSRPGGMLDNLAKLAGRAREQRGQTAAEYMGILLVVAVIIGAVATSGVGGKISDLIGSMIDSISPGDKKAPGAGQ